MSAWADQVENEEATNGALANNSDFPSLGEAMKEVKGGAKAKPKKGTKVPLGAFLGASGGQSGGNFQDKSLAEKAILSQLPTGPRGGPRDESAAGMGSGFRDYSGDRGGAAGSRFQRDDRPDREEREPSRADQTDDWGATRTFTPGTGGGGGGGSRGFGGGSGGFGDRGGDRPPREPRENSAADTTDDWGATRKYEPAPPRSGSGGFGGDRSGSGGYGDRSGGSDDRRGGGGAPSKADAEDSWGRGSDFKPSEPSSRDGARAGGYSGGRDAGRDGGGEDRWARSAGAAAASTSSGPSEPGERPRLKLTPRSAPAGGEAGAGAGSEERKPSSNPFGAARPREEVLREKGVDPIKEALKLEHGEVIRDETAAEKELKAEVEALAQQLADLKGAAAAPADPAAEAPAAEDAAAAAEGGEAAAAAAAPAGGEAAVREVAERLDAKERELLKLQAEEDDKVRFARAPPRREGSAEAARDGGAPKPRW